MRLRDDSVLEICDSKVMYDTAFEAELACAKKSWAAVPYKCPGTNHFHITHKNKAERLGFGGRVMKCPKCEKLVKRKGASKHIGKCKGVVDDVW